MKLLLQAEGMTKPRDYLIDWARFTGDEAELVEDVTGLTWGEFRDQVTRGGMRAFRALLWVLQRRENPTLRYAEVRPLTGDLSLQYDDDEVRRLVANIDAAAATGEATPAALAWADSVRDTVEAEGEPVKPKKGGRKATSTAAGSGDGEPEPGKAQS